MIGTFAALGAPLFIVAVFVILVMITLRRVVPTNMVHIVQSSKKTTPYGRELPAGNTYYNFPAWIPKIGVKVTEFPVSNFQVTLQSYEAYDQARLPFIVDVTAFFRIDNAETAAQRVFSFRELHEQLMQILQGAVRRVLAINHLESIMQSRSELGNSFTKEVEEQVAEWGVQPVKMIEFMDIRDAKDSKVIANIMAKEKSRIERESRIKVAENTREAELAEIEAKKTVDVSKQEAIEKVGLRTAEKDKIVGIATEQSHQEVQEQAKVTAEKRMAVQKVERERLAEIEKAVTITNAEASKDATILKADADLATSQKKAQGVKAEGEAKAEVEKALLMAPVNAQLALAKEIGENKEYQNYLITIEKVKVGADVGKEMASAIAKAELKIISNGGTSGEILGEVSKLADMFSVRGGTNLTGMLEALAQTDTGKAIVNGIASKLNNKE